MVVKDFVKRYRILFALMALLAALAVLKLTDLRYGISAQAKMDALRDFNHQKFYMQAAGMPLSCSRNYRQLLRERYKVTYINTGCVIMAEDAIYQDAYNEQLRALINKFHGKDIFEECFQETCVDKKTGKLWK